MAALESATRLNQLKNLLQPWTPMSSTVRWRTRKPNVQRPLPPHYMKAKYLAVVKPNYPDLLVGKPLYEVCSKIAKAEQKDEENVYETLLAQKARNEFLSSQMVGVFHENSTNAEERMRIYSLLHGHHMKFVHGSKKVITEALIGTNMESILKLHVGTTCYLCCKDFDVAKLLAVAKKMPTLILLGGYTQGKLMTRNQLTWCSQLPDIGTLRAELCSILSSATVNLSQNLSHHQMSLSRLLEEHARTKIETESS